MVASFHDLAKVELNEAAQYYEQRSAGLGSAFVGEVERCTAVILEHPQAGAIVAGSIRRRMLQRFPYALLYRAKPEQLRILAVMNLRRRPGYWIGRA